MAPWSFCAVLPPASRCWVVMTVRLHLRLACKHVCVGGECRVAARDSGKPLVDAAFGEVMVTCEKIAWLLSEGEKWLRPERRSAGAMVRQLSPSELHFTHV